MSDPELYSPRGGLLAEEFWPVIDRQESQSILRDCIHDFMIKVVMEEIELCGLPSPSLDNVPVRILEEEFRISVELSMAWSGNGAAPSLGDRLWRDVRVFSPGAATRFIAERRKQADRFGQFADPRRLVAEALQFFLPNSEQSARDVEDDRVVHFEGRSGAVREMIEIVMERMAPDYDGSDRIMRGENCTSAYKTVIREVFRRRNLPSKNDPPLGFSESTFRKSVHGKLIKH